MKYLWADLTLWIDPASITSSVPRLEKHLAALAHKRLGVPISVSRAATARLGSRLPFALGPSLYPQTKPLERNRASELMEDLVNHRKEPEASRWWQENLAAIERTGMTLVKGNRLRSVDELRGHLHGHLLPILDDLAANGWVERPSSSPGSASIGPEGQLSKAESVNHRFFLARSLGVRPFPLRIRTVHTAWLPEGSQNLRDPRGRRRLRAALLSVQAAHS